MNMTSMIDIVFLLIIFFMTVTQVSESNKEEVALPLQPGFEDQLKSSITVNVDRDGQIVVSGTKRTIPELIFIIGEELKNVDNDPNRLEIAIRQDKRGTSETVNEIVERLEK